MSGASSPKNVTDTLPFRSEQLSSGVNNTVFRPLGSTQSLIRYSKVFSSLAWYILGVIRDPTADPDLQLSPSHRTTGERLLEAMDLQLQQEALRQTLPHVRNLHSPTKMAAPPLYLKPDSLPATVRAACEALQGPFQEFTQSLLLHPDNIPPTSSHLRSPVGRFLALSSWVTAYRTFADIRHLFGIMAHLQWTFRMVGYRYYCGLCEQEPETTTLSYVWCPLAFSHGTNPTTPAFYVTFTTRI